MDTAPTPFEALQKAVEAAGSQSELARICGVSQPAIWKWLQSSKRMPAEFVLRVEAAIGISRHDLRPDIYPIDLPPAPQSRWSGVDHRAAPRFVGADRRPRYGNQHSDLDSAGAAR